MLVLRKARSIWTDTWSLLVFLWLFTSVMIVILGGLMMFPRLVELQSETSPLAFSLFKFVYLVWLASTLPVGMFLSFRVHRLLFGGRNSE